MKRRHEHDEPMVAWAFGEGLAPDLSTPGERVRAAQFQRLAVALRTGFFEPPAAAVDAARAVFPATRRVAPKATVLGMVGVRGGLPDVLQVRFEAEALAVRVSYERTDRGWVVLGEGPVGAWIEMPTGDVESDGGRFEFECASAAETGFVLRLPELEIEVPPATEAAIEDGL